MTTALMSDQALMPAIESCFGGNYFALTLFFFINNVSFYEAMPLKINQVRF